MPPIKNGILTSTGLPRSLNTLPQESLQVADEWYASQYTTNEDLEKIFKGYKFLSANQP